MQITCSIVLAVILLMTCEVRAQSDLIAVSWTGSPTLRIDPATGQAVTIGEAGFPNLNSLAINSAGMLYTADYLSLLTINPMTGLGTRTGAPFSTTVTHDIRALAFSSADILYGIYNGGDTAVPDDLYTINVITGARTLVGNTGFGGLQGLDFSPQEKLYAWDITRGLVVINQLTGVATDVNIQTGGNSAIQSIVFGEDGILYGAGTGFYTIDVNSGEYTRIGSESYTFVRGLEVIPEPSTWVLILFAACGGLILRRRRNEAL